MRPRGDAQRCLSKDHEGLSETAEAWVHITMTGLMLRRHLAWSRLAWPREIQRPGSFGADAGPSQLGRPALRDRSVSRTIIAASSTGMT